MLFRSESIMIKLTLKDRYFLNMYSRRLPSTCMLRATIDVFLNQINLTPEEVTQYGVKFDAVTGITSSSDSLEFEYESFPVPVIESIKNYIKVYDHEKNKENKLLQNMLSYFRKVL